MAIRPLRFFPDPILSHPCKNVQSFDRRLAELVQDLVDTLYHSPGVGVAAPQIGVAERVSVIDVHRSSSKRTSVSNRDIIVLVNPILLHGRGVQIPREGCLSVPDWLANVQRFEEVTVRAQDINGGGKGHQKPWF